MKETAKVNIRAIRQKIFLCVWMKFLLKEKRIRINAKLITNAKLYIYSVCLNAAKKKPATMINDKNNINAKVFSSFPMNKITKSKVAEEIATTRA